ncbi:MAG: PQQ-like beta-propeller repeat protein [Planctomycetaceae bacterium]|nr:PQQ-like beta-propeller repeat protein [Planctomycetaceae bacterium]
MQDDHKHAGNRDELPRLQRLTLAAAFVIVIGIAVALFQPWLASATLGGTDLNRYRPASDGEARLFIVYDADGKIREWTSHNDLRLAPSVALTTGLRPAQRAALGKHWSSSDSSDEVFDTLLAKLPGEGQLIESRMRSLSATGQADTIHSIILRTANGDYSVGSDSPAHNLELTFEPPLLGFPAQVQPGATFNQSGVQKLGDVATPYQHSVQVVGLETLSNEAGEFVDCLKVASRTEYQPAEKPRRVERLIAWYRPRLGLVEFRRLDGEEKLIERGVLVSGPGIVARKLLPPPAKTSVATSPAAVKVADWELHAFGRVHSSYEAAPGTIAPLWIDTDPPLLVAAAQEGDLVALSTDASNGAQAWQFRPGGTVLGPPCWDSRRACLYFGATDKRLYAIDARGMFLWSFRTADNIATRPVIADDRVIFASESGQIDALHAADGTVAWKFSAPSAIASSPVTHGKHVLFGCDDGGVYALDVETGSLVWNTPGGSPIDAPLAINGDRVFAVNHGDELLAFDVADGRAVWTTRLGLDCETSPVVVGERVLVVTEGRLAALDRTTGARLWRSDDQQFVGPVVSVGELLFVADQRGVVHQLDLTGQSIREWKLAANTAAPRTGAKQRLGLIAGGNALWQIDDRGHIDRLGPPPKGPRALRPLWTKSTSEAPFRTGNVNTTPVIYHDDIVVVDQSTHLFRLRAADGHATALGRVATSPATVSADMTIDGDQLFANTGNVLHAIQLPSGKPQWSHPAGVPFRPVEVTRDMVYWLSQLDKPGPDGKTGALVALDRQTGKVRWEQRLDAPVAAGGLVIAGDRLVVSTPPAAYDLMDGKLLWQATDVKGTVGGPGLSEQGDRVFLGNVNDQTGMGGVAAVQIADGRVVWQATVGTAVPNPMERVWTSGEHVIVPLWNGEIVALAMNDGAPRWRYQPSVARRGGITVDGQTIWFMQQNTELVGLDAATGQPRTRYAWNVQLRTASGFAPRPLIVGKQVIAPFSLNVMSLVDPE